MSGATNYEPLGDIAGLTKLQDLRIPDLLDPPVFSALRYLRCCQVQSNGMSSTADILVTAMLIYKLVLRSGSTALSLGDLDIDQPSGEDDKDIAALVEALPQLHKLSFVYFAASATNAGQQRGQDNC